VLFVGDWRMWVRGVGGVSYGESFGRILIGERLGRRDARKGGRKGESLTGQ
jgi:hypothetical protein